MEAPELSLYAGWIGIGAGVIAGAVTGLFFHRDDWLGGYNTFPRRLVRLGHVSLVGLGILNLLLGLSLGPMHLGPRPARLASICFLVAAITLPACCYLTAWHKPFRHLFPVPVTGVLIGIVVLLLGGRGP